MATLAQLGIIKPSFAHGFARNASESKTPHLWRGKVGHWVPNLGITGNTLFDISGNGNHGTLNGSMTLDDWVVGRNGYALDLDGINDWINIGNGASIKPDSITAAFWIFNLADIEIVIGGSQAPWGYEIAVVSNVIRMALDTTDQTLQFVSGSTAIANNWHHAAITYNSGNGNNAIYVDGVDEGVSIAALSGALEYDAADDSIIGNRPQSLDFPFTGKIDDIRIYNRALIPSEIMELYQNPFADLELRRPIIGKAPVVAGTTIPIFHHHYQHLRSA